VSLPSVRSRLRLVPIFLGQGVGVACGVAGVKLNSQLVPPEVLGAYGLFLTFAPIGMWVVHSGLLKWVARHWAASANRGGMLRAVTRSWARRLHWLALASVAGTLAMTHVTPGQAVALWLALFGAATLQAFASIAQTALQAERAHWSDCAVSITGSISRSFLPPILFLASGGALAAMWFGYGLHALATALLGAWALRKYWRFDGTPAPAASDHAIYQGPFFIALAIGAWLQAGMNRWIVAGFFGEVETGYFTLAGGAAFVISNMIGTMFLQYFQPGFFALGDGPPTARPMLARRVDQVALLFTVIGFAAVSLFAWIAPALVGWLINPRYQEAIGWVLPAGAFGIASAAAIFYHSMLLAGKREKACAPTDLTTAAVLAAGGFAAAAGGADWFARWLVATPLVPWIVTRPIARYYFFKP
jgi:hypothetical protein